MPKKGARPTNQQPSSLSSADVAHVAHLARLELSAAELTRATEQLVSVVGFVGKLQRVDTRHIPVTAQVTGLTNVMRPDIVSPCPPDLRERLLAAAPERADDLIQTTGVFA